MSCRVCVCVCVSVCLYACMYMCGPASRNYPCPPSPECAWSHSSICLVVQDWGSPADAPSPQKSDRESAMEHITTTFMWRASKGTTWARQTSNLQTLQTVAPDPAGSFRPLWPRPSLPLLDLLQAAGSVWCKHALAWLHKIIGWTDEVRGLVCGHVRQARVGPRWRHGYGPRVMQWSGST